MDGDAGSGYLRAPLQRRRQVPSHGVLGVRDRCSATVHLIDERPKNAGSMTGASSELASLSMTNARATRDHVGQFVFAVPLKPRGACADWEQAQGNLRRTIRSI